MNSATIYLILGGVRSGKSNYAMQLASQLSLQPVYIATARSWDDDFKKRIERHRADRAAHWTTIEEHENLSKLDLQGKVAVVDCVTLWLTNLFVKNQCDVDKTLLEMQHEFDQLTNTDATIILVSNEVGMSIHNPTEMGRKFADLQGWANQYIAKKAMKAILMVAGMPVPIK